MTSALPLPLSLLSERLALAPFCAADAQATYACITPTLTRYMRWEPAANPTAFAEIWASWLERMARGKEMIFTVRQRHDQRFVGLVGVHQLPSTQPELGIWIREEQHSQGFGSEAVLTAATWAAQQAVTTHFQYPVACDNHASRRIAERLGGVPVSHYRTPKYEGVLYLIPAAALREPTPPTLASP